MFSALPTLAARSLRRLGVVLALLGSLGGLLLVNAHPAAAAVPYGQTVSYESQNYPDRYVRHRYWLGEIAPLHSELDRNDATFIVRPGLAGGTNTVSLESANIRGHYLRHQDFRIKLAKLGTPDVALFNKDATFHAQELGNNEWRFKSFNIADHFIRHSNWQLKLEKAGPSDIDLFTRDSTWRQKPAANAPVGRGECTDWALYKRPDLVGKVSGDARLWRDQADWVYHIDKKPTERAVMVVQAGVSFANATAGAAGHVAYVETVQRDAYNKPISFLISEQNMNNIKRPTDRTIQVSALPANGVDFIYTY